jgi:SAM-dependent methyltransferase
VTAARSWAAALAEWAIPEEILARAETSPWGHPVRRFADRADAAVTAPSGRSFEAARDALTTGGPGSVLDVGAGAGAASLPLAPWSTELVAVDRSADMLAAYAERAAGLGVPARTVEGLWPQVAQEAGAHDLVVCHHVVYDVADIGPFVAALTGSARRRVVVELPVQHPMTWLAPLWLRFHDLARPERPTSTDFVGVLEEAGVTGLRVERWERPEPADDDPLDERAALVTRRLCLPAARTPEVATLLPDVTQSGFRLVETVSWSGTGGA